MLSRPLQKYEAMLLNTRLDHFRPDLTRSGWMASVQKMQGGGNQRSDQAEDDGYYPESPALTPEATEPRDLSGNATAELPEDEVQSASSSSSSSSTSDSPGEEELNAKLDDFSTKDFDEPVFQNRKSKVLHTPSQDRKSSLCGIVFKPSMYEFLPNGSTFKWARCGRCFKGEVISTPSEAATLLSNLANKRQRKLGENP